MDDLFLVDQIKRGNKTAFRFLVLRYQQPIFNLLGALIRDSATVEELAQETFLRAYRGLDRFEPNRDAKFSSWLFTIARNLAFNDSAKRAVRRKNDTVLREDTTALQDGTDARLFREERAAAVQDAISRLPEAYRAAVVLSYMNGRTVAEIAMVEGCSPGTVKSRIHRGKKMLRDFLSPLLHPKEKA